jgi:hypothetical protein
VILMISTHAACGGRKSSGANTVTGSSTKTPCSDANLSLDATVTSATRKSSAGSSSTTAGVNFAGRLLTSTSQRTVGKMVSASP